VKLPRRRFLHLTAGAVALPTVSRFAHAAAYPTRPLRLIVGYAAGSAPDISARLMAQWLAERLGTSVTVYNRTGAGANIANEAVAHATPDGDTLLWATTGSAIAPTLYGRTDFNFIREIAPVAAVVRFPFVMLVNPSFPARSVPEYIAYAKANPGKINMASSAGVTGGDYLSGEMLQMMTGVDFTHVPYRTTPFAELLTGQVQVWFPAVASALSYIKSGKLSALAVTSATRSDTLPDVPAMDEFVPGYESASLHGLAVSTGTSAEIVDRLNREVNAGLADPAMKERLAALAGTTVPGSPDDYGSLLASDIEKWAKVIKFANIKPE
jgi:tripartite-type tricarboxylate transporter receptor subunit TctC